MAPTVDPAAAPLDPRTVFVDYRSTARRWRITFVSVGIIVLLLVLVYAVRVTVSSPEATLRAYFAALADRDVAAALDLAAAEVAEQADRSLINEAVLRSEAYAPPADLEIGEVDVADRAATVEITYTLGGQRHHGEVRLRRSGGLVDALFHRWRVVDAIGTLVLTQAPDELLINGVRVRAADGEGVPTRPVLPGAYQVEVPAEDPVWEERATPVLVGPQQAVEVSVPLLVRPAIREEVERMVVALLDRCAVSTDLLPPHCPFGYAVVARASDVTWQITRYPTLAVTAGPASSTGVGLVVQSSREGEAVVTGTRRFVGKFEAIVPIPITGTASVTAEGVEFHPGW